jgi:hypothetical protein
MYSKTIEQELYAHKLWSDEKIEKRKARLDWNKSIYDANKKLNAHGYRRHMANGSKWGAISGALHGTMTLPGIGTAVGTGVGAVIGAGAGAVSKPFNKYLTLPIHKRYINYLERGYNKHKND